MISVKLEDYQNKVGKLFDALVGNKELTRGIYLSIDGPVAMRVDKEGDSVVIEFIGDYKPKLKIELAIISLKFTKIEKITIYTNKTIVKLDKCPDVELIPV